MQPAPLQNFSLSLPPPGAPPKSALPPLAFPCTEFCSNDLAFRESGLSKLTFGKAHIIGGDPISALVINVAGYALRPASSLVSDLTLL